MSDKEQGFQVNTDSPEQQRWYFTETYPEWMPWRLKTVICTAMSIIHGALPPKIQRGDNES